MPRMMLFACLLTTLALPALADGQKGSATAQELMKDLKTALDSGKKENVLMLVDQRKQPKNICDLMATSLMTAHKYGTLGEQAAKKYDAEAGEVVKQSGGFLSMMRLPVEKLAKGKVEKGPKGETQLVVKEKTEHGSSSVNVRVIEVDKRWYLDPNPGDPGKAKQMMGMLKVMLPAADKLIEAVEGALEKAKGKDQFVELVKKAGEAYQATMQDAMRKMQGGGR